MSPYLWTVLVNQISISFVVYSHLVPTIVAIALGIFLFLKTKKLSTLYLLLLCASFSIFAFFDLAVWIFNGEEIMFFWSILDIFSVSFFILSYWFLYSFVKERDLPLWQKVLTAGALVPTLVTTVMSINMNTYLVAIGVAIENQTITNYLSFLEIFFILLVIIFTIVQYRKAPDANNKKKIVLAGVGVTAFLFTFLFAYAIVNFIIAINLWGLASTSYVYNISPYALFGMPIFLAFLGYLIAKYQAFDVKLIKSIVYMVLLMVLLFVGLFFT